MEKFGVSYRKTVCITLYVTVQHTLFNKKDVAEI